MFSLARSLGHSGSSRKLSRISPAEYLNGRLATRKPWSCKLVWESETTVLQETNRQSWEGVKQVISQESLHSHKGSNSNVSWILLTLSWRQFNFELQLTGFLCRGFSNKSSELQFKISWFFAPDSPRRKQLHSCCHEKRMALFMESTEVDSSQKKILSSSFFCCFHLSFLASLQEV